MVSTNVLAHTRTIAVPLTTRSSVLCLALDPANEIRVMSEFFTDARLSTCSPVHQSIAFHSTSDLCRRSAQRNEFMSIGSSANSIRFGLSVRLR
jgi:hypothetical protein